jgi:T5SS/PEP-CTERM-associated repeat protein
MRSKETASYRRSCFLTAFGIALAAVSQNADISRAAVTQNGDNSANPTAAGADPIIGINNLGRLNITGGDSVTSDVVVIGDLLNGIGLVTVTDFNPGTAATSTWTTNSLMVGDAGTGRLEILNGAIVSVDFSGTPATGDFVIGNLASAVGTVIVDGLGSMLRLGDDTVIGQQRGLCRRHEQCRGRYRYFHDWCAGTRRARQRTIAQRYVCQSRHDRRLWTTR